MLSLESVTMDITTLFKSSVRAVRTRNKALGTNTKPEDPNRIFPRTKETSKFESKAKDVVTKIAKLHQLLVESRMAYLDASIPGVNQVPKLSQADRSEFDSTTQMMIKGYSQYLQELRRENATVSTNQQTREHRVMVVNIVEQYFKTVNKTYQELRNQYIKRQQELNRVTKLEGDTMQSLRKPSFSHENLDTPMDSPRTYSGYNEDDQRTDEDGLNFSAAEIQLLEKENKLLFNELNSLTEEVNQIHGQVVHIAGLQQTLTDKVLDQEKDIERIATTTVAATEHIREGNEQLRQALQGGSFFRLAIIFFLLVLSLSLLFLDWYYD